MASHEYDPLDPRREPLDDAARRAAELFVEIYRGLEDRPVAPTVDRPELTARFAGTLGDDGVGLAAVLDEFRDRVLPASMGTPHPLYLGLVNSSPLPAAALADLLVSSLNNNGGAFHQSPAMTACEAEVVRAFTRLYGLPAEAEGMFLPGGTWATLQALVLARFRAIGTSGPRSRAASLHLRRGPFLGRPDRIRRRHRRRTMSSLLPTVGRGDLDVQRLADAVRRDRRDGKTPLAVVATAGHDRHRGGRPDRRDRRPLCGRRTSGCTSTPATAGRSRWCPSCGECSRASSGPIRSPSTRTSGSSSRSPPPCCWSAKPGLSARCFDTADGSYIPGDGVVDAWRRGIPTTRRSSGFTVWMAIRAHGWRIIREAVRRNIELSRLLERLLAERGFTVLPDGRLSIVCARWEAVSG